MILGVNLDRGLTFRSQVADVTSRAKNRMNIMKALTSTTFGHSHESQKALYRQFVRPVLTYASMAWTPDLAESHM